MNTSIKISLDTRREKKDGSYPIILRLAHGRNTIPISLGYSVPENDWDDSSGKIKKTYKGISNVTRLNNLIQKRKANALDIITQLLDSGEIQYLTIKELKDRIVSESSKTTFYKYTEQFIDELKDAGRLGYAQSVKSTLNAVKRFRNDKDLTFEEFNNKILLQFDNYCRKNDLAVNSIAVYMKTIKVVFNRAIKDGYVKRDFYPFSGYKIKVAKTRKRAIRRDVIKLIEDLSFQEGSKLWHARNYFLFSFYTMGMNFADMAYLKVENLNDGRINYTRQKTRKKYSIKINSSIQEIMSHYIDKKEPDTYIFPIILRTENKILEFKDISERRRRYNHYLKDIAKHIGIETNLTSYVARHSWATIAKHKGVPIAAISEGMGHEDVKTTEIYLDSFDKEILDDYNEMITK